MRHTFGASSADFVMDSNGNALANESGTVWTAQTGGTRILDLLDMNDAVITSVTSLGSPLGAVQFQGPDDGTNTVWLDFGSGRIKVVASTGFAPLDNNGQVPTANLPSNADASAAVTAHEAAANPHAGYLTAAEADLAYDALGAADTAQTAAVASAAELVTNHVADTTDAHAIAGVTGLQAALDAKAATADLDAHLNDLVAAHAATAVSVTPAGNIAATDVQTALEELDTEKSGTGHDHSGTYEPAGTVATHAAVTTSVHGITDTSALETTTGSQAKVDTHVNDAIAAHAATAIAFTPAGSIAATTVQAAIEEVAAEAVGTPGAWSTYTPALTATTTNPTLGTGGSFETTGRYEQVGKTVRFSIIVRFGTAGVAAGSGSFRVSLPVAARSVPLGSLSSTVIEGGGYVQDDNAGLHYHVVPELITTTTVALIRDGAAAVTHNAPFAWAASDSIRISGTYEAA